MKLIMHFILVTGNLNMELHVSTFAKFEVFFWGVEKELRTLLWNLLVNVYILRRYKFPLQLAHKSYLPLNCHIQKGLLVFLKLRSTPVRIDNVSTIPVT